MIKASSIQFTDSRFATIFSKGVPVEGYDLRAVSHVSQCLDAFALAR